MYIVSPEDKRTCIIIRWGIERVTQEAKNNHELCCLLVCARVCAHLCMTLCDPMDCSLPGSSIHGILQTKILEWVVSLESLRTTEKNFCFLNNYPPLDAEESNFITWHSHILFLKCLKWYLASPHREGNKGWHHKARGPGSRWERPDLVFLTPPRPKKQLLWDFPGGPVVKTLPSNAEGMGSIPSREAKIPHASWSKKPKHKTKATL